MQQDSRCVDCMHSRHEAGRMIGRNPEARHPVSESVSSEASAVEVESPHQEWLAGFRLFGLQCQRAVELGVHSTVPALHNAAMQSQRHEAIGPRGDACIILAKLVVQPSGESAMSYSLATGERLRPTANAAEFETANGTRIFRLRTSTAHSRLSE